MIHQVAALIRDSAFYETTFVFVAVSGEFWGIAYIGHGGSAVTVNHCSICWLLMIRLDLTESNRVVYASERLKHIIERFAPLRNHYTRWSICLQCVLECATCCNRKLLTHLQETVIIKPTLRWMFLHSRLTALSSLSFQEKIGW